MAKSGTSYYDRNGRTHSDPIKATAADISDILGCDARVAMSVLVYRRKIEAVLAEYDQLLLERPKPAFGIIAGGRA